MKKIHIFLTVLALILVSANVKGEEAMENSVFGKVFQATKEKDGVREISYEQFMKIRNSGKSYLLFDVLSEDSYRNGHIPGAKNLPVNTIDAVSAANTIPKDANVIVYCGSFQCTASTMAAKKLSALGYKVLDYKGGLKEWKEKGNMLVR